MPPFFSSSSVSHILPIVVHPIPQTTPAPHYPNPGKTIALTPKKGIWLFHCHIEWHVSSGLMATLIEAPLDLQRQLSLTTPSTPSIDNNNNDSALTSIPSSHLEACAKQGVPVTGNAAGNTVDLLDLTGENLPPGPLAAGFQARGIVALVFSVVTAFAGMAVIGWYGWLDVKGSVGAQTAAAVRS